MYSAFCERYRAWRGHLDVVMRQTHIAGDKLFVDYAGHTMPVIDRATGEIRQAQIFVAVLGASNYTYAEATWTQSLPDWIGSHTRAFTFLGGVPNIVVPDNLKSGVTRAHRYDPDLNPTYQDMATHYGVAVVPARVRKPQDKSKVEVGVQIVERTILAVLRNRQFFSLAELSALASCVALSPASCSRTTPLPSYSADSINDPSRNYRAHATASSNRSTVRRSNRCPRPRMNTPSGSAPAYTSIITSRSNVTITRCRIT
ncbi:MAG: hypothetical protein ACI8XZ_004562 [Gammaproteobacteria bacterium]|jgi:hypothetical protein